MLATWRLLGEVIGERDQLHPQAKSYMAAAYQRQAAERLVHMLDLRGGAMLCDGVGLGKTYVANTVIAHYANRGRDEGDPFSVAVLAPGSVAPTWVRSALPTLAGHGVNPDSVCVVSHGALGRLTPTSAVLVASPNEPSALERLACADLVVVDEAHNFRAQSARRFALLRDLLRLQFRIDRPRRVLLLTATPVNNGLADLSQELALAFSAQEPLSNDRDPGGFRTEALSTFRGRLRLIAERQLRGDELLGVLLTGGSSGVQPRAVPFRPNLGIPGVGNLGAWLADENKRLSLWVTDVRAGQQREGAPAIARNLLDAVVVQRSRGLCQAIEVAAGSDADLMFRPTGGPPRTARFEDSIGSSDKVLARFLGLVGEGERALTLVVHQWASVWDGADPLAGVSPVLGLQRMLLLKRLESSMVSFLATLGRLLGLHVARLSELREEALRASLDDVAEYCNTVLTTIRNALAGAHVGALQVLAGGGENDDVCALLAGLAIEARGPITHEKQLSLLAGAASERALRVLRLAVLLPAMGRDATAICGAMPELISLVFSSLDPARVPFGLFVGREVVRWPTSVEWARRLAEDAKLCALFQEVIRARQLGHKVVVFSQFADSIAYVHSVVDAASGLPPNELAPIANAVGLGENAASELASLLATVAAVTGDSEDREGVVDRFAPYYRIGTTPPVGSSLFTHADWVSAWTQAARHPVDVLICSDVLAEGVNLQDAGVLINFDIHWNPVRMIQRAGRIDRRLNPRIERGEHAAAFQALSASGLVVPPYAWAGKADQSPLIVNLLPSDELERELLLRERVATKTLTIDLTLGLEQGTGAEADWMREYLYQGVAALNAWSRDRVIEQIGTTHYRFGQALAAANVDRDQPLDVWLQEEGSESTSPIAGRALLGVPGEPVQAYRRLLLPSVVEGTPRWMWFSGEQLLGGSAKWLVVDGIPDHFPARVDASLAPDPAASRPLDADALAELADRVENGNEWTIVAVDREVEGTRLYQGLPAFAVGTLSTEHARANLVCDGFLLLQYVRAPSVPVHA